MTTPEPRPVAAYRERISTPRRTAHGLHGLLTALTCGLWAPVWLCVWAWNALRPNVTKRTVTNLNPPGWGP